MARYAIAHCGPAYTVCRFPDYSNAISYIRTIRNNVYTWTQTLSYAKEMTEEEARKHAELLTFNESINARKSRF